MGRLKRPQYNEPGTAAAFCTVDMQQMPAGF